jgi:hypothetical protein
VQEGTPAANDAVRQVIASNRVALLTVGRNVGRIGPPLDESALPFKVGIAALSQGHPDATAKGKHDQSAARLVGRITAHDTDRFGRHGFTTTTTELHAE